MNIKPYQRMGEALVQLLPKLLEVVIHDLEQDCIVWIAGSLSSRKSGDSSSLDLTPREIESLEAGCYSKLNQDGRLLRAISIPLRDSAGKAKILVCINFDVSIFKQMETLSQSLLNFNLGHEPEPLFRSDWQQKILNSIHQSLQANGLNLEALTRKQKKQLVQQLYIHGAFEHKNAADFIAQTLHMGRATIFNYLREWRQS